jgi:hypothetical protein
MPYVASPTLPTVLVRCDDLALDWNGWAQPRWRSIVVMADAIQRMMPDARITFPAKDAMHVSWPDDPTTDGETVTRDPDGLFTLHGWTMHHVHVHHFSREHGIHICRDCTDAEGMIMPADDCTAPLNVSDDTATEQQWSRPILGLASHRQCE